MIKPKALNPGDTVGIIAPAGTFSKAAFLRGVEKIRSWGFKVKYHKSIFQQDNSFAGSDQRRAKEFNNMFADAAVKAIFCAKASYGSLRIINFLDRSKISTHPKIFLGYSDITVLLTYLNLKANLVVFHGPVVSTEIHAGMPKRTETQLLSLLTGKKVPLLLSSKFTVLRPGMSKGKVCGGNLTRVINTLGTPFEIDTEDKIILLEDAGISLEDLDGMLMQLKVAGKFSNAKGLIFGKLLNLSGRLIDKNILSKLIDDILKEFKIPIIADVECGHWRVNLPIPLGVDILLETKKRLLLLVEKPVT